MVQVSSAESPVGAREPARATPTAARRRRRTNDSGAWTGPFERAGSCWPTAPPRA